MAKITILADHSGSIIGTFQGGKPTKDAPGLVRIRPREGQHVYEMEVPDQLAAIEVVHRLHSTHRLETKAGAARLVENNG